ncbi:Kinase/ NEK / Serine/threonine protein kinase [Giardia duodenalis assemblage B]|uniref:Kinase/ NEK / Serine/threonine protein kinase n=1 Tax=Giardia duodenalis assemblage B TaxID=1394984 RepID=A0A132NSI9_GIAIN|nr:Kinase/ NEK / Serine/threonine protein kinase [Giardia intestinalis assemblage B]
MIALIGYDAFIKKYSLCSEVPQSGYDKVYRVESKHGGSFYTCRELSYSNMVQGSIAIDSGIFTALLSIDHPCIAKIYDIYHDTATKKLYIVTELLEDSTLENLIAAHIRTHESMIEEVVWRVAAYLSSALYYLLFQFQAKPISAIFKRFITPRDCVVCRNGLVKLLLTDLIFVINPNYVKLMSHQKQCYCAPEILLHLQCDNKSEMWSLGCILYELCTLKRFIEDPNPMLVKSQADVAENRIVLPGYSEDICELLNSLLRYEPGSRYSAEYVCSIKQCTLVLDTIKEHFLATQKYERDYIPVYNGSYSWDHNSAAPAVYNQLSSAPLRTHVPPHQSEQHTVHGHGTYSYDPSKQFTQTFTPATSTTYFNSVGSRPQTDVIPVSVDSRLERRDRNPADITYTDSYTAAYSPVLYDSLVVPNRSGVDKLMSPLQSVSDPTKSLWTTTSRAPPTSYTLQNMLYEQSVRQSTQPLHGTYTPPLPADNSEQAIPYDMIGNPVLPTETFVPAQPPHLVSKPRPLELEDLKRHTRPAPNYQATSQAVIVADIESRLSLLDRVKSRSANTKSLGSDATLLMQAVINFDNNGVVRNLALAGKRTHEGISALMLAASVGNMYAIRSIVEHVGAVGQKETRMQDYSNGKTALMYAVEGQHEEAVQVLAKHEATMTLIDGTTALMLAAVRENIEIVKTLANLEGGMVDSIGRTALVHAMGIHNYKVVSVLAKLEGEKQDHNGLTPLMVAAKVGDNELVDILKLCGLNLRTPAGETALMAAAAAGHVTVCRTLAPQYAGAANIIGMTALMYAAEAGHDEICEALLPYEKGKRDTAGRTALMYAASTGQVGCVRKLLRDEERMRATDGSTALIIAAELGFTAAVAELVKREAGIARFSDETALSMAIMNNRKDCVHLLLKAEGMLKCPGGMTPAEYAAHLNRNEILAILNSSTI